MSNSVQTVVSNGSLALLDLSINYFDRSHIKVSFDGVEQALGTTWDWVGTTDKKIQFTPVVASGVVVQVKRQTPLDAPRHVYSSPGNAPFNKSTIDENFQQMLYASQEAAEGASLTAFSQDVSAANHKLTELGDAVLDGDAVNLKVLREYLPYGPAAASLASRVAAEEAHSAALAAADGAELVGFKSNSVADFLAQALAASNLATGKVAKVVACVLRNEGAGWYAIDDTGHVPVGLSSLSIVGKALNLTYGFSGTRVISLLAVPDERVASWGVMCGTSVGQNSAQIYFHGPLSGAVTNAGIQFNTVLGHDVTQTVDAAAGTIAVTHDALSHTAGNGSAVTLSSAPLFGTLQASATKFGFNLTYTRRMDFSFSWPAGVLTVASNCAGVTAVWDATGNYIQVTHPNTGGVQQVSAQETNAMGAIHARVSNITATGFRVYFYNTSGVQITTPSSSLVPYCTREVDMPAPIPAGAVGFYNRDSVPMNAANFVTGANGNIWVIGLIEADL